MLQGEEEEEAAKRKTKKRGDVDMEVTFGPALEGLSQRLADKAKSKEAKTLWEQIELRRRCDPDCYLPSLYSSNLFNMFDCVCVWRAF